MTKINIEAAIQRIRIYAFAVRGWTKKELAQRASVAENTLRHIHDPAWNATLDTVRALEAVIPADWDFEEVPVIFHPNSKGKPHDVQTS